MKMITNNSMIFLKGDIDMSNEEYIKDTLYVEDSLLNSVLKGGDIKYMTDLQNSNLKDIQLKHGYIANYQIYKNRNEIKNTSSDIVIHINHIRTHYKQNGIMTVTLAHIIKSILVKYNESDKSIEINLVKSGEVNSIKKEVYYKLIPRKPSEKSRVRYEVFKPENRTEDIEYYNRLIEKSKYNIVELSKKSFESIDKMYYEDYLLEELIEVTKAEVTYLHSKYYGRKDNQKVVAEAIDNVSKYSNIERLIDYYMGMKNESEEVSECLSSISQFKLKCVNLKTESIDRVFDKFHKRKQRIEIMMIVYLLLSSKITIESITTATNIKKDVLSKLKSEETSIENLNFDTVLKLYEYAVTIEEKQDNIQQWYRILKQKFNKKRLNKDC